MSVEPVAAAFLGGTGPLNHANRTSEVCLVGHVPCLGQLTTPLAPRYNGSVGIRLREQSDG